MKPGLIAGFLVTALAVAQTFEVASIRPSTAGGSSSNSSSDGLQWHITNTSLKQLIEQAFDIQDFQVSGPDWLGSERFDLAAKMPAKTTRGERSLMLRSLLAERFGLDIHHSSREMTGFALISAKSGSKFKPSVTPNGTSVNTNNGRLQASGITMEDLAKTLATELARPVTDQTGIAGRYDLTLDWTPDEQNTNADVGSAGSIFTAIQEQLGLRLQSQKVPVDVIVVDHVKRTPTEN